MQVAVRPDLVPRVAHRLDQLRMALGHPADHEHRGPHIHAIEEIEEDAHRELDSRRQLVPALGRQCRACGADVKPLLEIDREDVPRGSYPLARSLVMKSAMASTETSTFMPVCSSAIATPKLRSISRTSSRTSIESSPSPVPNSGVESPISSAVIGSRRLRTIACLISAFRIACSHESVGAQSSPPSTRITWPVM
jgi:hypothetical protein